MATISYPYLPTDRTFRFVSADDPFMVEARRAQMECSGDPLFPIGAVLVKDGRVVARAGNGFNRGSGTVHVCPRFVLECPSGTGYELCHLHDAPGHAESMLIQVAREQDIDPTGTDIYLYGHWWCCEPCWDVMLGAGIQDVYLLENAREEFRHERVWERTLKPSRKRAYIAGAYTNNGNLENEKSLHEAMAEVCQSVGCEAVIPYRDNPENVLAQAERNRQRIYSWTEEQFATCDVVIAEVSTPSLGAGGELVLARTQNKPIVLVSKKGSLVSNFALGNPLVVYHVQYDTVEDACRQVRNVLRQL